MLIQQPIPLLASFLSSNSHRWALTMATILDSRAAFIARAQEHGLTNDQLNRLRDQGITSLAQLAFALATPGTAPDEESLKNLLSDNPDQVTVGQLSSIRRLTFDAQTLSAAQVKHILAGTETARKAELVPAERSQRIQDQRDRLLGMDLSGPLECSHASYDYVAKMLEQGTPMYLEPHRFTTRSAEVAREKPGKELILDQTNLTVKEIENKDKCPMQGELQVFQALTRRSLACDLMGVCTFRTMERWHRFLMDSMQIAAPPGYKSATIEQILRADRAGWIRLAERIDTLRRAPDGSLPLDKAIDELRTDPSVVFHMMPLPMPRAQEKPAATKPTKKESPQKPPSNHAKGHGKGKGKNKNNKGKMPLELVGFSQTTKSCKRVCYNYNLARSCPYAEPNKECSKGMHVCIKCGGAHPLHQCSNTTSAWLSRDAEVPPQQREFSPPGPKPQEEFSDPGPKPQLPDRCIKRQRDNFPEFDVQFSQRVFGKSISDLLFIEVFSGTGGLTAAIRHMGLAHSIGVDAHVTKKVKSPIIRLDLTSEHGLELLWRILQQDNVAAVHLGPPCGTSSRARDIRRQFGSDPKPLRSVHHPDGLPWLQGLDLKRVISANALYDLTGKIFAWCCSLGILCAIENPVRSHMWRTTHLSRHLLGNPNVVEVCFHTCMYLAQRKKRTKLLCNHKAFEALARDCDGNHQHLPWGHTGKQWATAQETEYPHKFCQAYAQVCYHLFLQHGALALPQQMDLDAVHLTQASRAALGTQPRGKKLKPLVREYATKLTITGPKQCLEALPDKCMSDVPLPLTCTPSFASQVLPQYANRLQPPMPMGDNADLGNWTTEYGIAWKPHEFIQQAAGLSHPGHFMDGVHPAMVELFDRLAQTSTADAALERSARMRKWLLRAQELRDQNVDGLGQSPPHVKRILKGKNIQLFDEMNKAAGSPDVNLASNVCKGFDLMGAIPAGGIFPCKYTHATLTPEQVRDMSKLSRQATWRATGKCKSQDLTAEVYKTTCDECERGWLLGPFQLHELPARAVLTRRFGIQQSATLGDGSRVYKTRPIDDFSESLVNSTNSCSEAIQPMSIDMILAALAMRFRKCGSEKLFGKAIDLRKAYKNLPLSQSALEDAYICVFSPETGEPVAFQSQVLPFGARAAVMGFCRVSYAIWLIGVAIFNLHWTVFFDDFYLVASEQERKHIDLAQRVLFQLLGWEVSSEKGAEFDAIARILGVQIDLSESCIGVFTVCNVDARVKELVATIDHILAQRTLSAAEMRVLRGRLVFAEAQIFGRIAGLHMQQLGRWEHAIGHSAVDPDLEESLTFLRNRIILGGPRRVLASHGRTFHLYTDACLENGVGGIGGVLLDQCGKW